MVRREALDESRLAMDLLGERSCDDDRDLKKKTAELVTGIRGESTTLRRRTSSFGGSV